MTAWNPKDPITKRAFEIYAERGWDADRMDAWIAAVAIAKNEGNPHKETKP